MARMIIPKNTASIEEVMGAMQIYYDANDWVSNADFIQEYKLRYGIIGDDTDSSAYTKKTEIGAYYGFIEWEDITRKQSPRRITPRGRVFLEHYNANDIDAMHEDIMCSLEQVVFGRNNFACCSCDSDVEPPSVFLRAMIDLGHLTNSEFAYLIYKMEYEWRHYTDLLQELRQYRNDDISLTIPEEARKFKDPKPILILERWGVLDSTKDGPLKATKIAAAFYAKYEKRLKALKIYNVDKNISYDSNSDNSTFTFYFNNIDVIADAIPSNLSIDDLGRILAEMYNNASAGNQSNAIRMFGVKYGGTIIDNGYSAAAIVKASGINASYDAEVSKGISIYKSIRDNEYGIRFADEDVEVSDANDTRVLGGYNKIYYGAPGCGKSFIVNKKLDDANVPEANRIRVTFHPEYANCDFVGQILPTIEKKIDSATGEEKEVVKYIFNPGPFTLALERARKTNDMVYLIIEEINRGNAAAIFGDLFQLLDREKDMTKPNWGESEYPICNVNIQKYLGMDEGKSTVIPSNLTILATMNTSDQSVFTLDTAFKRRWSFEQISNNIEKDTKHKYKGWYVPGTNVTLERFLTVINAEILRHKITSEDKRMGKYFISKDCLTETPCDIQDVKMEAEMFAYKVLEYIWNDVCKIGKDEWFDTVSITTLEDLIDAFVEPSSGETPLSVFKSITF